MLTFFTNCYRDLTFSLLLYRVNMPFVLVREVFFHLSYFPPLFLLPVSEGKTFYLFPPLSCWVLLWKGSFSVILFHEISPLILFRGELIFSSLGLKYGKVTYNCTELRSFIPSETWFDQPAGRNRNLRFLCMALVVEQCENALCFIYTWSNACLRIS